MWSVVLQSKIKPFCCYALFFAKIFKHDVICFMYARTLNLIFSDIDYLRNILPAGSDSEFFDYLLHLTTDDVTLYAIDEGTVVFPKVPLMRLEGPLPVVQLLETTLLNLVNYAR